MSLVHTLRPNSCIFNRCAWIYEVFSLSMTEYEELKNYIPEYEMYRFIPSREQLEESGDGGVAIIDQWIAAHAR